MRSVFEMLSVAVVGLSLGACAESRPPMAAVPPLYVPSAMISQPGPAEARVYDVLPSSDAIVYDVGRPEKAVWGSLTLDSSSSYSIFTYDNQLISNLWGPSYRYRWVVQQGVTIP